MNVSKVDPFTYKDGSVTRAHFHSNDSEHFIDPNKPFMTTPSMEKTRLEKKVNDGFGSNGFGSKPTDFASPIQKQAQQNNIQVQRNIQPLQGHIQYNEQPSNVIKENQASQTGYLYNGKPITAEQNRQIQEIQEKFSNERKQIERDRILGHSKNILGAALEIGSAAIPGMGGAKITGALGKKFMPMFGTGEGLLKDKNVLGSTVVGGVTGAAGGALTGGVVGQVGKAIDGTKLAKHKPFDNMVKEEMKKYRQQGKEYYKDYLQGTTLHKEGYGDIYFNREGAGKAYPHSLELYPELKKQLEKAELKATTNDKLEPDRYYDHLINNYDDKIVDYIIEVIKGSKHFKMSKYL